MSYRKKPTRQYPRRGGSKTFSLKTKKWGTVPYPKGKKPVDFFVTGEQPKTPPVIYCPSWPPPEAIVNEIKEEMQKNPNRRTASDLEAMAYLQTASLAAPLNDQACQIYFYLMRSYLKGKGRKKFDGSMDFLNQHQLLSEYDERELRRLKGWIFEQQKKALRERERQSEILKKDA